MTTPTSTSTADNPFVGSSSASPYSNAPLHAIPCPHAQGSNKSEAWWQRPESVIALMGMALTGVVGYFSATLPIRDAISDNLSRVKVLETKIEHVEQAVADTKKTAELAQHLDRELAVLEATLNDREKNNRKLEK